MEVIIKIESLVKSYPKSVLPAIANIDLEIFQGEKFGVFGPNGAGKTTLISMMCGILIPDSGSVKYQLNHKNVSPKTALNKIGYVPQDFAFYPELTAYQNLSYFGKMYGIPVQVLNQKIDFLLEKLGLSPCET